MSANTSGHGNFAADLGRIYWTYAICFIAFTVLLAVLEHVGIPDRVLGYLVVVFTLAAYATIGILARTMQVVEFYVAGRRVPAIYNGMAAAANWTSGAVFIGLAGSLFVLGHDGLAFILGLTLGFILIGAVIAPYLRKFGAYTIPDFLATRFASPSTRFTAIAVLVICSFTFLTAQLQATGAIASRLLGLDADLAVGIALVIVLASTVLGGLRSMTWTQVAQYIVMIIAFLVPAIVLAGTLYDLPVPPAGYVRALTDIAAREQQLIGQGLADPEFFAGILTPFGNLGTGEFIAVVLTLAMGAASFPHLLMHYSTSRNVGEARRSVAWTLLFVTLILVTVPAYAIFTKLAVYQSAVGAGLGDLPEWIASQSMAGLVQIYGLSADAMADQVAAVRGAIDAGAADISAVTATLSGDAMRSWSALPGPLQAALFNAISENPAAETVEVWRRAVWSSAVLNGNVDGTLHLGGIRFDPGAIVFAASDIAGLPAAIKGTMIAGALAAVLSTAAGLLTAIANTLSHDAYYRTLNSTASTAQRLVVGRVLMIAVAGLAAWVAIDHSADALQVVGWSFSLAAAGFFPALVLAVWWKRASAAGTVSGMIAGLGSAAAYIAIPRFTPDFAIRILGMSPIDRTVPLAADLGHLDSLAFPAVGWFGVSDAGAGLLGVAVGFVAIVLVSLAKPAPSPEIEALIDDIRTPQGRSYMERERAAERIREFGRGR